MSKYKEGQRLRWLLAGNIYRVTVEIVLPKKRFLKQKYVVIVKELEDRTFEAEENDLYEERKV